MCSLDTARTAAYFLSDQFGKILPGLQAVGLASLETYQLLTDKNRHCEAQQGETNECN